MSQPTFSRAQIVADTIVPTVELGVTISDAAVDARRRWCERYLASQAEDGCAAMAMKYGSTGRSEHRDTWTGSPPD